MIEPGAGAPAEGQALARRALELGFGSDEAVIERVRAEVDRARGELALGHPDLARATLATIRNELDAIEQRSASQEPAQRLSTLLLLGSARTIAARLEGQLPDMRRRFDEAVGFFDRAQPLLERGKDALRVIGESYLSDYAVALAHDGRYDDARAIVDKLPPGPQAAKVLRELASAYTAAEDDGRAIEALRQAAELDPDAPDVRAELGAALERTGDRSTAATAYCEAAVRALARADTLLAQDMVGRALEIVPRDHKALTIKGELLRTGGRTDEALVVLEHALEADPASPLAGASKALALLAKGRFDAALTALEPALAGPDAPQFLAEVHARALLDAGHPGKALKVAKQGVERNPDDPWAHWQLAEAARALDRHRQVIGEADVILRLDPTLWRALVLKSQALRALEPPRLEEALVTAQQALVHASDHSVVHVEIAECLRALGQLDDAAGALRTAIALEPAATDALTLIGEVSLAQGRPHDACRAFQGALDRQHDLLRARVGLARALMETGAWQEALQVTEVVGDEMTGHEREVHALLAARAEALRLLGRVDDAETVLRAALGRDQTDPSLIAQLGRVMLDQRRPEAAFQRLSAALKRDATLAWALRPLAEAAMAVKRHADALKLLARVERSGQQRDAVLGAALSLVDDLGANARRHLEASLKRHDHWNGGRVLLAAVTVVDGDTIGATELLDRVDAGWSATQVVRAASGHAFGTASSENTAVPEHVAAQRLWVYLLRRRRDAEGAEFVLRSIVANPDAGAWAHEELGRLLLARGEPTGALEHLHRAVSAEPTSRGLAAHGDALIALGEPLQALDAFTEAAARRPLSKNHRARLVRVLKANYRDREACDLIESKLSPASGSRSSRRLHARVLLDTGLLLEALRALEIEVEDDDEPREVASARIIALSHLGDYRGLVEHATRQLEEEEDDWLYAARGWGRHNLEPPLIDEAQADFEQANRVLADRSPVPNLNYHKGIAECIALRGEDPSGKCRWVLERLEGSPMPLLDKLAVGGWMHYRLREWDRALETFKHALALDNLQVWAQFDFALTMLCSAPGRRARTEYRRGIDVALRGWEQRAVSYLHVARVDVRSAASGDSRIRERVEESGIDAMLTSALEKARGRVSARRAELARARATPGPVHSR